jgi:hypothetical protein
LLCFALLSSHFQVKPTHSLQTTSVPSGVLETPWTLSATFVTVPYHCVLFTNVEKTWERKLCGSLRMCHPLLLLSASKPVPTDPELLGTYVKNMTIRVPLSCYSIAT